MNTFERFLLLAGGSNANSNEGPKGAQEVLHVLDALKECLPLMSAKYTTVALKYFKTLLELRQPLVTRRITDSLLVLCINPDAGVSAESLLNILCSLAHSASTSEMSVDAMTFTARLLDVGMAKVYSLNREICVVKLPVVFNALRGWSIFLFSVFFPPLMVVNSFLLNNMTGIMLIMPFCGRYIGV